MLQPLETIFADIGIVSATFHPIDNRKIAAERGGIIHPTGFGVRVWTGSVNVAPRKNGAMNIIESRFNDLIESDGAFRICHPVEINGTQTQGTVTAINVDDRREFTLSGVPVDLSEGDFVGIVYGGGKRSLHHVRSVTGSSVRAVPPLPLGIVVDDVATFGRSEIVGVITSGGLNHPSYGSVVATSLSFEWAQTLRVVA